MTVHAGKGLYFDLQPDGTVLAIIKGDDAENAQAIKEVNINRETWDLIHHEMTPHKRKSHK